MSMGHSEEIVTDKPTWIIDRMDSIDCTQLLFADALAIDGTTNFIARLPFLCISIGFAVNKEVIFGIIYNPILDELFTAQKGQGAKRNGASIHVSQCDVLKVLSNSLLSHIHG